VQTDGVSPSVYGESHLQLHTLDICSLATGAADARDTAMAACIDMAALEEQVFLHALYAVICSVLYAIYHIQFCTIVCQLRWMSASIAKFLLNMCLVHCTAFALHHSTKKVSSPKFARPIRVLDLAPSPLLLSHTTLASA
jgi:hypothetical protein